jgi:hypothetical protein
MRSGAEDHDRRSPTAVGTLLASARSIELSQLTEQTVAFGSALWKCDGRLCCGRLALAAIIATTPTSLLCKGDSPTMGAPLWEPLVYFCRWECVRASVVIAMAELENSIARLELWAEQLILHLRSMQSNAPGAEQVRSELLLILLRLVALKGKRQRLEEKQKLDQVA